LTQDENPKNAEPLASEGLGGVPLDELMLRFESLGENCEFGLVQRRGGAEPLGLLRFSSTPLPQLLAALSVRFEGFGKPDRLKVELSNNGREYMVRDEVFGLYYHAWVLAGERTPEEVHRRELRRLPYLTSKLIDDLTAAEKLFVYRTMGRSTEAQMLLLHRAMRAYGENTLLWMELADAEHEAGSVVRLGPGLLRGFIDRFAPGADAHDFSFDCWVRVLRAALLA
jgi:hypothetical protein